jgi:hypothetical protein
MTSPSTASDFSQLTYLLHLITTINSEDNLRSSFEQELEKSACATSDPEKFLLLDSITAILVQRHEIVAACYTSDKVVSVITAEDDSVPATDVEIDDPAQPGSLSSSYPRTFYALQLAAVSNPEFPNKKKGNPDTGNRNLHSLRIQAGVNLWPKVKDTKRGWYFGFM